MKASSVKPLALGLLIVWAFHVLSSCSPAKQAQKDYDKAMRENKKVVANNVAVDWPCITGKVKPGDSTEVKERQRVIDSTLAAYKAPEPVIVTITKHDHDSCPELTGRFNKAQEIINTQAQEIKDLNLLLKLPAKTIHDTLPTEDSSKIWLANAQADSMWQLVIKRNDTIAVQKEKIEKRGRWNLYLIIACLALGFGAFIGWKSKL